jgi:hypothetical protein
MFKELENFITLRRNKENLFPSSKQRATREELSTWEEVYQLDGTTETYVKLHLWEDSYGENEQITGISFVKPKKIEITEWED